MGHDVTVVNSRRVRLIAESTLKTDRLDAEVLAQLSCFGVACFAVSTSEVKNRAYFEPVWELVQCWCDPRCR